MEKDIINNLSPVVFIFMALCIFGLLRMAYYLVYGLLITARRRISVSSNMLVYSIIGGLSLLVLVTALSLGAIPALLVLAIIIVFVLAI